MRRFISVMVAPRVIIPIVLLSVAVWLLWPPSGNFARSSYEELISSCALNDGTAIKLYRGNAGATVAFWYVVTDDPPGSSPEREIIGSYSEPEMLSLTCGTDKVAVNVSEGAPIETAITALERLRTEPLNFWRGEK